MVEKVAAAAIPDLGFHHVVFGPEEDRAGENKAEGGPQSAVMRAVGRHAPLDENLARERNSTADVVETVVQKVVQNED